jgi:hypothetical protein
LICSALNRIVVSRISIADGETSLMKRRAKLVLVALAIIVSAAEFPCTVAAAQPSTAATRAYNNYLRLAESRMAEDYRAGGAFIPKKLLPEPNAGTHLSAGHVLIRCVAGCDSSGVAVPNGLIHDWLGVAFVPGASLPEILAFVQDYGHAADHYAPNVTQSRLLSGSGQSFRVFLQLKQTELLTILFNTEYEVRYVRLDDSRVYSVSHSTRIAQLAQGSQDRELPPAENDGFLWRLDSYWRFEQVSGGVYIQCRAISLSRDIPRGLAWIVAPFIKDIPRKSLQFILTATRAALLSDSPAAVPSSGSSEHNE